MGIKTTASDPVYSVGLMTPESVRRRYVRSILVLCGLGLPVAALVVLIGEPYPYWERVMELIRQYSAGRGWPAWLPSAVVLLAVSSVLLGFVQGLVIVVHWLERKVAAHMQVRLGPMRTGGWHGWAQPIADGIKLFMKEDIVPESADRWLHFLGPIVAFVPAYVCFIPIPFGRDIQVFDMDMGLLFVFAISGLSVLGILMGGWASANKYSALGGLRAAAQLVSYEIPRVISIVPVVMWAGTVSLSGLMAVQSARWGGIFPKWFIFYPVVGQISFVIYLISSVAETNRTPFDIPEAESELVSGFHTEYAGMKFAFFFLAEYSYVFLASALGAVLFLGGGDSLPYLEWIPSYAWFFAKTFFLVFLFLGIRWTYPRMRVDRLMEFCWKFLFPWSLVNVFLAGLIFLWRWR